MARGEQVHYNAAREKSASSMSISGLAPSRRGEALRESNRLRMARMLGWYAD
jgi:hypothetical protein